MDDPVASGEQTALLATVVVLLGLFLIMLLLVVAMFISLKTERDVNEVLKAKIVKRMIQCP